MARFPTQTETRASSRSRRGNQTDLETSRKPKRHNVVKPKGNPTKFKVRRKSKEETKARNHTSIQHWESLWKGLISQSCTGGQLSLPAFQVEGVKVTPKTTVFTAVAMNSTLSTLALALSLSDNLSHHCNSKRICPKQANTHPLHVPTVHVDTLR